MTINMFVNEIIDFLKKKETEYTFNTKEILKNNGNKRHAIEVTGIEGNMCPCIYMDGYYEEYKNGTMNMNEIVQDILVVMKKSISHESFNIASFMDWETVKCKISCRLINKKTNLELLQDVPYRDFLDLAIVYQVRIDGMDKNGVASILIHNAHLKIWEKDEKDLYQTLIENMTNDSKTVFRSMGEVINELDPKEDKKAFEGDISMYVLSNSWGVNGASEIVHIRKMEELAQKIGGDFIVLPSSVHETILIPANADLNVKELAIMVKAVNDTQVAPEEILSYHVYRFYSDRKELQIVA